MDSTGRGLLSKIRGSTRSCDVLANVLTTWVAAHDLTGPLPLLVRARMQAGAPPHPPGQSVQYGAIAPHMSHPALRRSNSNFGVAPTPGLASPG